MKWKSRRCSSNVEDNRGRRVVRKAGGGGIGIIVLALAAMYFGIDPQIVLNMGGMNTSSEITQSQSYQPSAIGQRKSSG